MAVSRNSTKVEGLLPPSKTVRKASPEAVKKWLQSYNKIKEEQWKKWLN